MNTKSDTILFFFTWVVMGAFILLLLASCEKESFKDHVGSAHDSVPTIIRLGNVEYEVIIECWGTGLHGWMDYDTKTPAYDVALPESQRSIYYRRYTVAVRPEPHAGWQWLGWGVVQDTLWITEEKLNKEKITLKNCN